MNLSATKTPAVNVASIDRAVSRPHGQQSQKQSIGVRGLELWHLLSLDAPTIAMLWTWFIASENHIHLPLAAVCAMGITVWMLYAADRLLDARAILVTPQPDPELAPRHYFHRRHQTAFRVGILAASITLAVLLPQLVPQSIRLYLVLGTLLFGYFILIHLNTAKSQRLPKELAVGVFFSAATFIPTVARNPGLRLALLPGAVLFAAICSLNCLFIYKWEHPAKLPDAHPATRIALQSLPYLVTAATLIGLILSMADRRLPWPIPAACAIATALLMLLHRTRHHLSPTTLRATADLCLLTPLLLLRF